MGRSDCSVLWSISAGRGGGGIFLVRRLSFERLLERGVVPSDSSNVGGGETADGWSLSFWAATSCDAELPPNVLESRMPRERFGVPLLRRPIERLERIRSRDTTDSPTARLADVVVVE